MRKHPHMYFEETENTKKSLFEKIAQIIVILIGFLLAYLGLSEYYNIVFAGKESAYAFGTGDNIDVWLYQSAKNYSIYMLCFGLIFLMVSSIAVWAIIKRKLILQRVCIYLIVVIFIIDRFV